MLLGYYIIKCHSKCVSTRGQGGHLGFPISPKNTNLVEDVEILLGYYIIKCHSKCVSTRGQGGHLGFPISPKNTNLVEDVEILLSVKCHHIPVSEEKSKRSQQIRGQGGHLVFPIRPKNTKLVEDLEILLPVKFLPIQFSSFREEVKNVSANQSSGWPSCFSDRPEKHKLHRERWDLGSCQVLLHSVQRFQRISRKCES